MEVGVGNCEFWVNMGYIAGPGLRNKINKKEQVYNAKINLET